MSDKKTLPYWQNKSLFYLSEGVFNIDELSFQDLEGIKYQLFYIDCRLQYQDRFGRLISIPGAAQNAYRDKLSAEIAREMMAE